MSHQQKQPQFGNEDKEEDIRSIGGSEWSLEEEETIVDYVNSKQKEESNPKIALLEVKNQILLGKLENLELKAQIRAMTEEANLNKLREENKAIRAKMEAVEEKAQIAKNEFETIIQEQQVKMAILKEQLKKLLKQVDLLKSKKGVVSPIANPSGNIWRKSKNSISTDGLTINAISNGNGNEWHSVSAEKGFKFSVDFPGPALYYFEIMASYGLVGLSSGNIPNGFFVVLPNYYTIQNGSGNCYLSGKSHKFEWPNGAIKPKWNGYGQGNFLGCGLVLNPENELSVFFTVNGILMAKQIPINPSVDSLYPTVSIFESVNGLIEANFGDDSAKPFKYDIKKCPGLVFE